MLHVISIVSNPVQFQRRYKLFREFTERMGSENQVNLVTVELQQGNRPFVTDATFKLRTYHELWVKENLINYAVHKLPSDWEYMAWIDSDIVFENPNWVSDTIERLQTYKILQLFSHAIDLGPNYETLEVHTGFAYQFVNGEEYNTKKYGRFWHPGYAWAMTRKAYNHIGGLIDFAILGSADNHMALAFIGQVDHSFNHKLHPNYQLLCTNFQKRCDEHIKHNIGFVHGTIRHFWHGDKKNRKYRERWQILVNHQFDPLYDLKKDHNNLWQLENNKPKLRDAIRAYFRGRNEDAVVVQQGYPFMKNHWW